MIDIETVKSEIVERLKRLHPEKIILFGSYAYGIPTEDSDLDLYVVTRDDFMPKNWEEKSEIFLKFARELRSVQKHIAIDLITHTLPMHKKFLELNSSLCREIMGHGKELYAG